jgi:glycosyltransferase involved in cell wall biosynthesis/predicted metal-dependent phosphoesterase TrpH
MAKIDLHLHSKYSEHPSEWFLQRIGAKESYTEPEFIYQTAKKRGMDFVTITDHNKIDGVLLLKEKYPNEVITGVETTTYFPENGCKIHVLFFGITEEQFENIQKLRENIYVLHDYIKSEDLAYSLAHATFPVNGKLHLEHIEKLLLLFDVFEGINGGRNDLSNNTFVEIIRRLTPNHFDRLYDKHKIDPMSDTPWVKAFTGGSDDHAGLFVGKTYTLVEAENVEEVVTNIKRKKISAEGRHNDYKSLAFTVYKIAYEFSKTKGSDASSNFFTKLNEHVFESKSMNLKEKLILQKVKSTTRKKKIRTTQLMIELIEELKKTDPLQIEERLDIIYEKISAVADEFFKKILSSVERDIASGDIVNIIMNVSSSIPGLFVSFPFFSALRHMFQSRELVQTIQEKMGVNVNGADKKILWFTDTIDDLNGVSETLKELSWISYRNKHNIKLVTANSPQNRKASLAPNMIFLPTFFNAKIPNYEDYTLHFPSILKSMDIIQKEKATEIYISTPGPIGLFGILVAKLLNIKASGIYHTDFTYEVEKIVEDHVVAEIFESYTRWFYSMMDSIKVHTNEYINLLEMRGLDRTKLNWLPKGIDPDLFMNKKDAEQKLRDKTGLTDGPILLYTGRVSKDKDLDFLIDVYKTLNQKRKNLNLLIVGSGPYLEELKHKTKALNRVYFTGRIPRKELPEVYSGADLFLFPSTTDTFGMVVMEAQACELPALVSDLGGPKEIIVDGVTGKIASNNQLTDWLQKIEQMIAMKEENSMSYHQMKKEARKNILNRYSWDSVLENILNASQVMS